jgi:hypothetical protein
MHPLSSHKGNGVETSRPNVRTLCKRLNTLTTLKLFDEFFGVKINTDRVRLERLGCHELVRRLRRLKVVELRLHHVAIGVVIIEAGCGTMIRAPDWFNAFRFTLAVGEQEVRQRCEGEGDVLGMSAWVLTPAGLM